MCQLCKTGVTIILTTHYIEEAQKMADHIGFIRSGEVFLVEEKKALLTFWGEAFTVWLIFKTGYKTKN